MLDKSADDHKMGYHPKCKNLSLTHLSFSDDILMFSDGNSRSIESIPEVFSNFAAISGLLMSVEKSTFFVLGLMMGLMMQRDKKSRINIDWQLVCSLGIASPN